MSEVCQTVKCSPCFASTRLWQFAFKGRPHTLVWTMTWCDECMETQKSWYCTIHTNTGCQITIVCSQTALHNAVCTSARVCSTMLLKPFHLQLNTSIPPSFSVYPVHVVCSSSSWGEPERVWTTLVCGLCMGLALCMYVYTSVGERVMCGVRWCAGILSSAIFCPHITRWQPQLPCFRLTLSS